MKKYTKTQNKKFNKLISNMIEKSNRVIKVSSLGKNYLSTNMFAISLDHNEINDESLNKSVQNIQNSTVIDLMFDASHKSSILFNRDVEFNKLFLSSSFNSLSLKEQFLVFLAKLNLTLHRDFKVHSNSFFTYLYSLYHNPLKNFYSSGQISFDYSVQDSVQSVKMVVKSELVDFILVLDRI